MKKELDPAGLSPISNLKIIPETELLDEHAPYFDLKNEFAGIINFNTLTTPFLIYPLDHEFNRTVKRVMDIFYVRHWSPNLDIVILCRTIRKSLGM